MGSHVDIAFMKFCYVDGEAGTDIDSIFSAYRDTLARPEADFPGVIFVHMIVPLVTRETASGQLNSRLRRQYGTGKVK